MILIGMGHRRPILITAAIYLSFDAVRTYGNQSFNLACMLNIFLTFTTILKNIFFLNKKCSPFCMTARDLCRPLWTGRGGASLSTACIKHVVNELYLYCTWRLATYIMSGAARCVRQECYIRLDTCLLSTRTDYERPNQSHDTSKNLLKQTPPSTLYNYNSVQNVFWLIVHEFASSIMRAALASDSFAAATIVQATASQLAFSLGHGRVSYSIAEYM